eukprot:COSAG05_NODE_2339_length_3212_cov_3.415997_5_plen_85_part_01
MMAYTTFGFCHHSGCGRAFRLPFHELLDASAAPASAAATAPSPSPVDAESHGQQEKKQTEEEEEEEGGEGLQLEYGDYLALPPLI